MEYFKYIPYVFYFLLMLGLNALFSDSFVTSIEARKAKAANEKMLKKGKERKQLPISEYIERMISTVNGKAEKGSVMKFYELSIFLAMMAFVLTYFLMTAKIAPLAAVVAGFMPFLCYRTKLQGIRNETSREGEILTSELLSNYKIYHTSMRTAIENTIETISSEAPHSKKLLIRLQYDINAVASKEGLKEAIDRFKFGIGTNWSIMLATNIELSLFEGLDVTSSMEDLIQQIARARKAMEETKRQGSEARRMLKFLVPGIYLLTLIASMYFFGMSFTEFCHNQFKTPTGSTWFLIVCVTYIASIAAAEYIGRDKMDI